MLVKLTAEDCRAYLQDRKPRIAIFIDVDKRQKTVALEQSTITIVKLLQ